MALWTKKWVLWRFILCSLLVVGAFSVCIQGVTADEQEGPSESQCRPYIEKALKDLEAGDSHSGSQEDNGDSGEAADAASSEDTNEQVDEDGGSIEASDDASTADGGSSEEGEDAPSLEVADEPYVDEVVVESDDAEAPKPEDSGEDASQEEGNEPTEQSSAEDDDSKEAAQDDGDSNEASAEDENAEDDKKDESVEDGADESGEDKSGEVEGADDDSQEAQDGQESTEEAADDSKEDDASSKEDDASSKEDDASSKEENASQEETDESEDASKEQTDEGADDSKEQEDDSKEKVDESGEQTDDSKEEGDSKEQEDDDSKEQADDSTEQADDSKEQADDSKEEVDQEEKDDSNEQADDSKEETDDSKEKDDDSKEQADDSTEGEQTDDSKEEESKEGTDDDSKEQEDSKEDDTKEDSDVESEEKAESKEESDDSKEKDESKEDDSKEEVEETEQEKSEAQSDEADAPSDEQEAADGDESQEGEEEADAETPEDDLLMEIEIPENLRAREHVNQLLRLDEESTETEMIMEKSADVVLRELKRLYDNAIKPLEILYKYRDLSNRHFGDPEIFSKPLVLFMGPWSGGKSSLINYLTDNEFTEWSLRTGAEPSPAYFNILMHGKEPEVLDGTQLAADWTFSGLQKFGQGLEERLRGLKLPNKLLERVNIVEIPGILEVRKQVSRVFPFNDACQWFIDRADIIFLVYDPSKLDVGPETEAILDQLKGRESQTRIILNKADQVKPEELMRVQSALIWNISPLMSSAQPPVMYTTSLWSIPYEVGSPARLLQSQERAFLRDLREAMDKRIENKISSARRFAVRVRNHAKMVDCYLTTYYNHKTIFGNKKVVAEAIIEHPQNYHIYEGLSTLTNISRYDLPDPETYRDFFRLNPLYEFQQLSATCTYFRGCPINRLDVAIAYDLPELVGKYKKMVETATPQGMPKS